MNKPLHEMTLPELKHQSWSMAFFLGAKISGYAALVLLLAWTFGASISLAVGVEVCLVFLVAGTAYGKIIWHVPTKEELRAMQEIADVGGPVKFWDSNG